jgi:hypothetical protein
MTRRGSSGRIARPKGQLILANEQLHQTAYRSTTTRRGLHATQIAPLSLRAECRGRLSRPCHRGFVS